MSSTSQTLWACSAAILSLATFGCAHRGAESPIPDAAIHQFGTMRSVMREGLTESRTSLTDWKGPDTIAVGAVEGLDGEITIVDGGVWVSRVRDGRVLTSGPAVQEDDHATLLVASREQRWQTIRLDAPLAGADLEAAVERAAAQHGVDTSQPFPFVIQATAASLDMHVINGFCPHSGGEAAVDRQPLRIALENPTPVTIVGFYARDSQGVLTHHGTSTHAHALFDGREGRVTGHIDSVGVRAGALLRLPDPTRP